MEPSFFQDLIVQAQHSMADSSTVLPQALARATDVLVGALQMDKKVLTCGNGGSAGDAQHIASELINRFETERMPLAAISLVPDSSVVTAISNDYNYEVLFSRQIDGLGRDGDVLIAFSTSGNSRNIARAIDMAHKRKMTVIAMTGRDGGAIGKMLGTFDVEIRAPAQETSRIQEIHLTAIHSICKALDSIFTGNILQKPTKVQLDWDNLVRLTRGLRPLVFTNGVFDILHRGHIAYLEEARKAGICMVVGINDDESVRRLKKGIGRPIQCADDRAHILASLKCVDFVTLFNDETPAQLIRSISPDVLIKGGDYQAKKIVGADHVIARGGIVKTIDLSHQKSTTSIVQSIINTHK